MKIPFYKDIINSVANNKITFIIFLSPMSNSIRHVILHMLYHVIHTHTYTVRSEQQFGNLVIHAIFYLILLL